MTVEELSEELLDLGRTRELLYPLEARPGIDPEKRPRILRIQIDRVRQISGLFRRGLRRLCDVVVVFLGRRRRLTEAAADRDRIRHSLLPAWRDRRARSL